MELKEQQVIEMYVNWLLNECTFKEEEIEYLFDNLPKDDKERISLDMQDKANDIYLP